ncbi:LPXTG cell wall anchor domain-containing protein [Levilactobacillus zymae]|uniref:mucin-binding protein n=1 Tax=Levilactobacillus zymae TaxID=267363 RepID=UPI0028B6D758|nr:LPXTG cell wall anchor domain-containing protein [Levilactobacillus zymae]MDT6980190.1 LPXTG cell wall anchor domain-containing protein [Levilactobacillus zymae]
MHSLEGLQNATHLKTIYLSPDPLVGYNTPDPNKPGNQPSQAQRNGNLWDIRALASLNDLTEVNLSSFSINDISALAHKAQLKAAILDHNQIADISPLATDHQLNFKTPTSVNVGNQHILLTPVTLPKEVSTSNLGYTTPSFIIKNQQAQNLPITGLDSKTAGVYLNSFPTTGAVGNANANTLTWFHLQPDSTTDYGNLTASWSDPDCDFSGIIIQPYALADQVGTVTVQTQALQADGRQLNLGPTALISGTVGTTIDLNDNAATLNLLQEQTAKGYRLAMFLDGTGQYSDLLAGNGKTHKLNNFQFVLTTHSQHLTMLFYRDVAPWNVDIHYVWETPDHQLVPITDPDGHALEERVQDLAAPVRSLATYQKSFPDYVYQGAEISQNDRDWQPLPSLAQVSFLGDQQEIRLIYHPVNRATVTIQNMTTGKTLQTLTYTQDASLRGAWGTTSEFTSAPYLTALVKRGYRVIQDPTKTIKFAAQAAPVVNYVILVAQSQTAQLKTQQEVIHYLDHNQHPVAPTKIQTMTFLWVTNQVTKAVTIYQHAGTVALPELTAAGHPQGTGWRLATLTQSFEFPAVENPQVAGQRVVATTAVDQDLTQTPALATTANAADIVITVTYALQATPQPQPVQPTAPGVSVVTPTPEPPVIHTAIGDDQIHHPERPESQQNGVVEPLITGTIPVHSSPDLQTRPIVKSRPARRLAGQSPARTPQLPAEPQGQLPQTNERSANFYQLLGLSILSGCLGLMGIFKHRR